uniref:non-specific serine/threonine protein kinase n=1 Tax=Glossina brevipalpis TaxID=37001 RepID=A0A1A9WHS5_9MUSC
MDRCQKKDKSSNRRISQLNTEYEKVKSSDFKFLRVLGEGGYGKVYLVRKKGGNDNNKLYAMKVLKKAAVRTKKLAEYIASERQILEIVDKSPFVVGLHYAFQTPYDLCLVLDYVSGGDLFMHLCNAKRFSNANVKFYIAELVLALEHLHKLNIIHRDIKLENILLDKQGHIVLTDFGLSKIFSFESDNRTNSFCGTLEYMAPEIMRNDPNGYDVVVDWWSVGVVTYELLTGVSPFVVIKKKNSLSDILKRIENKNLIFPRVLCKTAKDFIIKMLEKDPKKRLGCNKKYASDDIKKHPFFRGINWDQLKNKNGKVPFKPTLNGNENTQNFNENFKNPPVIDSPPAGRTVKTRRLFRGYSYVALQHLRLRSYRKARRIVAVIRLMPTRTVKGKRRY